MSSERGTTNIVVISVMTVVCLADSWDDIKQFATLRQAWLRTLLELANGIPSADTFRRVFTALDPGSLVDSNNGKLIAIDGKTVRYCVARKQANRRCTW